MLIGREKEQKQLLQLYASSQSEFVALYGRRRVGKKTNGEKSIIVKANISVRVLHHGLVRQPFLCNSTGICAVLPKLS